MPTRSAAFDRKIQATSAEATTTIEVKPAVATQMSFRLRSAFVVRCTSRTIRNAASARTVTTARIVPSPDPLRTTNAVPRPNSEPMLITM